MTILDYRLHSVPTGSRISTALSNWWTSYKKLRDQRRSQRTDRKAFQNLLYLDDGTLADIGYQREDVIRANKLPIEINAAHELKNWSRITTRR